jgi:hypothetical protein
MNLSGGIPFMNMTFIDCGKGSIVFPSFMLKSILEPIHRHMLCPT